MVQAFGDRLPRGVNGALLFALLTLAVRLGAVWLLPIEPLQPDYAEYHALAQTMAEEGTYGFGRHLDGVPELKASYWPFLYERHDAMFRPPGYPLFMLVISWFFGPSHLALALALACVEALTAFVLFRLVERHYGPKAATLATLLFAFSPGGTYLVTKLAREALLTLATLVIVFAFFRARQSGRVALAFGIGLLAGLATYVKETALLLVISAAAWCVFEAWRTHQPRVLRLAVAVCLGAGLMISPWIVRNSLLKHKPMGFTCVGFQWYVSLVPGGGAWRLKGSPDERAALDPYRAADCADVGDRLAKVTQLYLAEHPTEAAMTALRNAAWFWSPVPRWTSMKSPSPLQRVSMAETAAVLLLSAIGFWQRRREPFTQFVALMLAITTVAHLTSLGVPRFRVPFEPLLFLFAALAVESWLNRRKRAPA